MKHLRRSWRLRHARSRGGPVGVCVVLVVLGTGSSTAAAGAAAKTKDSKPQVRTVDVEMMANAFKPTLIRIGVNETIQFRFINKTVAPHEALIGDTDVQIKHAKEMKAVTSAGSDHMDHMNSSTKGYVLVKPKSTKTLSYRFTKEGRLLIGCHQPGHWEGGMKLTLVVQPKSVI